MPTRLALLLLAISLLAACRDKEASSRRFSGAPPAEPSREEQEAIAAAPGALTATGQVAFQGASSYFCVPSSGGGLQVDFRTGSQEMPTVAVRIESYRGSGPYSARLFVTGRSSSGALVTSTGEASVDVKQQDPAAAGAAGVVSGTFQGRYAGAAGRGSIEGRFASCNYSPSRGGSSPPVAGAISATDGTGGKEEQPAGAAEETHERPSDTSRVPAHPRAGDRGASERSAATGRRGRRARSAHGGSRSRGRRGRGTGVRGAG